MQTRLIVAGSAVLLAAVACGDDARSPTEPRAAPEADVAAAAALTFWQLSAGAEHTCGVTTDQRAYCWGMGSSGQLGNGTQSGPEQCDVDGCSRRPVAVLGGLRFRHVSAGAFHTCGVTTENRAYCWGNNYDGQLGNRTQTLALRPVPVAGTLLFRQVDAGAYHTCGVTTEDQAYCWGANYRGQLGDGTQTMRLRPVPVLGGRRFHQVRAGDLHTCGVTKADRAFCWGYNLYGQLGDTTTTDRRSPTRVAGGRYYRQIDVGAAHTCAVTTGGRAFCWGNGIYGQIGNGRKTAVNRWPKAVAGGLTFARVTTDTWHNCAETGDTRAYCWGSNVIGQLGIGTDTGPETCEQDWDCSTRPVAVSGGLYFAQVDTGRNHTCGKTGAGVAYCWGYNFYGQLGDGTSGQRLIPTKVIGPA